MTNKTKLVDIVKVSSKGQIVIPKEIRESFGIVPGRKLIVFTRDEEILLKKVEKLSIKEISERIGMVAEKRGINVDKIISEAIEWARKSE